MFVNESYTKCKYLLFFNTTSEMYNFCIPVQRDSPEFFCFITTLQKYKTSQFSRKTK